MTSRPSPVADRGADPAAIVIGAVLAGGRSRRMGTDKALIEIDGRSLVARAVEALAAAGATTVLIVGGAEIELLSACESGSVTAPVRWMPDPMPGLGPLAGLVAALAGAREHAASVVAILPCDLVSPSSVDVAAVVEALVLTAEGQAAAAGAVAVVDGRRQWLVSAWSPSALEPLRSALDSGERAIRRAVADLRIVDVAEVSSAAAADVDTPEDLAQVRGGGRDAPTIPSVDIPSVDVSTARQKLESGEPVFDVRQPEEFAEVRAPGVRLVPLAEVPERVAEFATGGTVYVICKSGGRSARAVEFLRSSGIDAVNVEGGTLAWVQAGFPVESGSDAS